MTDIYITENKSFDEILAEIKAKMPSDITLLESDPATKILEIVAFREMILRERINNAAKSNLLAFADEKNLDYLAEFYGISRQDGEIDDVFRERIKAKIAAFSTSGTKEHYRFHALSSSVNVKDALASSPEPGLVRISILSNSADGTASSELLETVRNHVMRDDIKMLTDTVEIVGCTIIPVSIMVEIRALNSFVLPEIREKFIQKFNETKCLGWSPSVSWIIANLFTDNVTHIKVVNPTEDLVIASTDTSTITIHQTPSRARIIFPKVLDGKVFINQTIVDSKKKSKNVWTGGRKIEGVKMTNLKEKLMAVAHEKLADILVSLYEGNNGLQKQLDIIFAGLDENPKKITSLIKKEISSLKRSSRYVDYWEAESLSDRLNDIRLRIINDLNPKSPQIAF